MITEAQVRKAIKAMDEARNALEPLSGEDQSDAIMRLRSDLRQTADYLESARWWRKKD